MEPNSKGKPEFPNHSAEDSGNRNNKRQVTDLLVLFCYNRTEEFVISLVKKKRDDIICMWYCLLGIADPSLQPEYCTLFFKDKGISSRLLNTGLKVYTSPPTYRKCLL